MNGRCEHRRKKRIYTHGKKSTPMLICKDCGEVLKRYELKNGKRKQYNKKWKRK